MIIVSPSGPVAPLDPGKLAAKGSLFLTRPTLAHYCSIEKNYCSAPTICSIGLQVAN